MIGNEIYSSHGFEESGAFLLNQAKKLMNFSSKRRRNLDFNLDKIIYSFFIV